MDGEKGKDLALLFFLLQLLLIFPCLSFLKVWGAGWGNLLGHKELFFWRKRGEKERRLEKGESLTVSFSFIVAQKGAG